MELIYVLEGSDVSVIWSNMAQKMEEHGENHQP